MPGHSDFAAGLVRINLNVVAHAVGRVQAHDTTGGQPAAFDQAVQHALCIGIHAYGLSTDDLVFQNRREWPRQVPSLKKRTPVNEFGQLGQVKIFENAATNKLGHRRRVAGPVHDGGVGPGLGQRPHGGLLFVGVLQADFVIVAVQFVNIFFCVIGQQTLRNADAAGRVGHIHHRAFVMRRNLDGRMHARAGGTANQQRYFADAEVVVFLHLGGHVLHFFQAGGDEATQAHNVCALNFGARQNLVARYHHAHIDDFKIVALKHHGDDVFANVMHVALDGRNDDFSFGLHIAACGFKQQLFGFNVGQQMRHGLLHDPGTFHHLR